MLLAFSISFGLVWFHWSRCWCRVGRREERSKKSAQFCVVSFNFHVVAVECVWVSQPKWDWMKWTEFNTRESYKTRQDETIGIQRGSIISLKRKNGNEYGGKWQSKQNDRKLRQNNDIKTHTPGQRARASKVLNSSECKTMMHSKCFWRFFHGFEVRKY